ncbi:unnamed protein product [Strongylus vulgaris]|uniref:Uncharacterized protein n=1 Tax=Strongylus vulgaris TaxID=40348 RepID=A0A3P7JB21_STRVU|nr:unnamed protein product [Strongylus vulgaris]
MFKIHYKTVTNFQISIKFSNLTEGDVVLLDDLSVQFTSCSIPARITPPRKEMPKPVKTALSRQKPQSPNNKVFAGQDAHIMQVVRDTEILKKRLCKEGECTTIIHHPSAGFVPHDRMCIGRVGLMQCREKCLSDGAERTTARCVRQHEFPFQKRCLCQVRRSPMHTVDGGSHKVGKNPALRNTTEMPIKRALLENLSEKKRNHELDAGDVPLLKEDVCTENNGDEVCDRKCSSNDTNSSDSAHYKIGVGYSNSL